MSEQPWRSEFSYRAIKVIRSYRVALPDDGMPSRSEMATKIPIHDAALFMRAHGVGKRTFIEICDYILGLHGR